MRVVLRTACAQTHGELLAEEGMSVEAAKGVGVLRVHLKRGAGLKAADLNGFSDPYVKVLSGGQQKKTKIIKKTLNPEWNEAVDLAGSFDDFVKSGLLLKVMDWDRVGFDDPLGDLPVQLDWLHTQSHLDFAERLPTKGTMYFGVTWLPTGDTSAAEAAVVDAAWDELVPEHVAGRGRVESIAQRSAMPSPRHRTTSVPAPAKDTRMRFGERSGVHPGMSPPQVSHVHMHVLSPPQVSHVHMHAWACLSCAWVSEGCLLLS